MPRMDGKAVLRELKADPELRSIPVVVLTTSDAEPDVRESYALGANAYVTKPRLLDGYYDALRILDRFWLSVAALPH